MDLATIDIWETFAKFGLPGLALAVFYLLFRTFRWKFSTVPRNWVGPIVVLFMIITAIVVLLFPYLYGPKGQIMPGTIPDLAAQSNLIASFSLKHAIVVPMPGTTVLDEELENVGDLAASNVEVGTVIQSMDFKRTHYSGRKLSGLPVPRNAQLSLNFVLSNIVDSSEPVLFYQALRYKDGNGTVRRQTFILKSKEYVGWAQDRWLEIVSPEENDRLEEQFRPFARYLESTK
jgi:hypothetical protein